MKSFVASSSFRRWLAAALVTLACATSTSDAVTIDASSIAAPSSDLGQFQTLEKTWTVSGSATGSGGGGLRNLLVATPAAVFVDYDPSIRASSPGVVAKVVVTGDSEDLINAIDVVLWAKYGEDDGIELRFHSDKREFRGHLLTTILVGDKQALRTVKSVLSGDVVVTDDVLAVSDATAQLKLSSFSSGDVRVFSTQKLAVKSLALSAFASGEIEIQAPSIDASQEVSASALSTGIVAVIANEITSELVSSKVGSVGDVYIQADNLVATTLESSVDGTGDVTLSRNGKCVNQIARVTREGDYCAGSIVCEHADIGVFNMGMAIVQVTGQLDATVVIDTLLLEGNIQYVNAAPKDVVVHGPWSHDSQRSHEAVKQAIHNRFATFPPSKIPQRSPELVEVRRHRGSWFFSADSELNLSAVLPSSEGVTAPVAVVGIVGVIMGVVGVAAVVRKFFREQGNRAEFTRLV